jgi:ferrochelatase
VCPAIDETNARCYRAQCYATSHAIAQAADAVGCSSTSFQSRLQGASWISPFTDETLALMAYRGLKRVAVACPSFVADCLETIEEIGIRGAETFKASGGEQLELITAVNDSPVFIAGLAKQLRVFWST